MILPPAAQRAFDPAKGAARLLGWFGLAVLMVGAPLVGVLSRSALFVLLPIGAAILLAGFLLAVSDVGLKAVRRAFRQPIGVVALFFAGWTGLSLIWTPFPADAGPLFLVLAATALVATVIIVHIPERRPRPTLFLLPAGLVVTALATLGMALFGPRSFRGGTEFDPSLLERSILTLVVLLWPALGALGAFGRWAWAMAVAALVAIVITTAFAQLAMASFAIAAIAFAVAVSDARRAAWIAAAVFGGLILLAPVLPFILAPLASSVSMVGHSTVVAMADWRDLVSADNVRLITGHGFGTAHQGVASGYLPAHTPRTILFEVWYELGLLGAITMAASFALGFLAAGEAAAVVAPALIGGMAATLAIAFFGVATAENWYVTLVCLQAIAFGLLCRSSRGGPLHLGAGAAVAPAATFASRRTPFR